MAGAYQSSVQGFAVAAWPAFSREPRSGSGGGTLDGRDPRGALVIVVLGERLAVAVPAARVRLPRERHLLAVPGLQREVRRLAVELRVADRDVVHADWLGPRSRQPPAPGPGEPKPN